MAVHIGEGETELGVVIDSRIGAGIAATSSAGMAIPPLLSSGATRTAPARTNISPAS
ncbi:hypothetical protein OAM26_03505 [Porticoccaceae bacterium]|nr:hypothetical protein [Porticoccaceae bacterium]